jgi:hypothetical protein
LDKKSAIPPERALVAQRGKNARRRLPGEWGGWSVVVFHVDNGDGTVLLRQAYGAEMDQVSKSCTLIPES